MNQEIVAVELPVRNLVRAKGHVADSQIEEILPICVFKACDGNIGLRVKVLRNPAGDAVQLYAVQSAIVHAFRQKSEEIADTTGRLQDIAGTEAHLLHSGIDRSNHGDV